MINEHVAELLARSFDEHLSQSEQQRVVEHLGSCAECRQLETELRRSERLVASLPTGRAELPALAAPAAPASALGAFVATAAVLFVALLVGGVLFQLRSGEPVGTEPPTVPTATPTAPPVQGEPFRMLVARPVNPRQPYGAIGRIDVLSPRGEVLAQHDVGGVVIVYDGGTRVAYWQPDASGGQGFALVLWDLLTDETRVLLRTGTTGSTPIWSADRAFLVFVLEGDEPQLVSVHVASSEVRQITSFEGRATVYPVYADDEVVAGYAEGGGFEVVDARTGASRSSWPHGTFVGYGGSEAGRDGVIFTLVANFEAPDGPLHVWRAASPSELLATVDWEEDGLHSPLFRPGHAQLVYGSGFDLKVLDYGTGESRLLHTFPRTDWGWPRPVAFDEGGAYLLVETDGGYLVFSLREDGLERVDAGRPLTIVRAWVFGLIVR